MMKNKSNVKGITLIALVITVIVLLILAGAAVSIGLNGGDVFSRANQAKTEWNAKVAEEDSKIKDLMDLLEEKKATFVDDLTTKTHTLGTYQEITKFERATQEPAEQYKQTANVVSKEDSDYQIYMWAENNVLYWYSEADKVELPANCTSLFGGFTNLDDANGVNNWDTSNVTNMDAVFGGCYKLTSIDISNWNTQKVTSMSYMFSECYELTSLDLSSWDTSNVTNMECMFNMFNSKGYTSKLQSIIVSSGFKVDAVTNSTNMFAYCTSLVGGQGTTYSNVDATMAHIDGGTSNPGYFTAAQSQ